MFQQPNYSNRQKQNVLINAFVHSHDLLCLCKEPAYHCLQILAKNLAPSLNEKDKLQIQKCLGMDTTDKEGGEEDVPGLEDLEKLFAEDPTEEDTG